MINRVFRVIITLCGMLLGYGVSSLLIDKAVPVMGLSIPMWMEIAVTVIVIALFGIIFFYLYSTLIKRGKKAVEDVQENLSKLPASELISGVIGLVVGLIVAFLIKLLH